MTFISCVNQMVLNQNLKKFILDTVLEIKELHWHHWNVCEGNYMYSSFVNIGSGMQSLLGVQTHKQDGDFTCTEWNWKILQPYS
jgi:hypothetical protein